MTMIKTCTKCGESKSIDEFHSNGGGYKKSACKVCVRAANRKTYADKREERKEAVRNYRQRDIDAYRARERERRQKNLEKARERDRKYREIHKEKRAERYRQWVDSGRSAEWQKKRYHQVLKHREEHKVSSSARSMLRRVMLAISSSKSTSTEKHLGYSFSCLKQHLERNFCEGMSWENYGEWHVDHIVPVAEMIRLGITCPKKINALKNLRPAWSAENIAKRDKFELVARPIL